MSRLKIAVASLMVLLVLVFVTQNTEIVTVRFLVWELTLSRVILILLATATGFLCGFVVARLTAPRVR